MAGPIQLIPKGLLGFLQLKNMGRLPNELVESYQPVIEMRDWMFSSYAETLVEQSELVAGGFNGNQLCTTPGGQVPADEFWFVRHCTLLATQLGATENISMAPAVQFNPNTGGAVVVGPATMLAAPPPVGTAAGRNYAATAENFWMPPGAILAMAIGEAISGGNLTVSVRCWGTRLAPV